MVENSITIIPCPKTFITSLGCRHAMDGVIDANTSICVWCSKWRENHSKDGIIYACDPSY